MSRVSFAVGLCFPAALAALVLLFVQACTEPVELGQADAPRAIINGKNTGAALWNGVVVFVAGNIPFCTGTLIHPEVVLTAGHCVWLRQSGYNYATDSSQLSIKSGANVGFNGAGGTFLPDVDAAAVHPIWQGDQNPELAPGPAVDLGLIHLSSPVTNKPIYCLRGADQPLEAGGNGVLVGYGQGNTGALAATGTRRYGIAALNQVWESDVGLSNPATTCRGDSGGPLFTEVDGTWLLTAVTSRGPANCTTKLDSISQRINPHLAWIDEVVSGWAGAGWQNCTATGPDGDTDTSNDPDLGENGTTTDTDEPDSGALDTGSAVEPGDTGDTGPWLADTDAAPTDSGTDSALTDSESAVDDQASKSSDSGCSLSRGRSVSQCLLRSFASVI